MANSPKPRPTAAGKERATPPASATATRATGASTRAAPADDADADKAATPPKRGRGRPALGRTTPLERSEILAQAHRILDEEGLDALSMRHLADRLGVTPMALYHHVPNKPALLWALCQDVWEDAIASFVSPEGVDMVEWAVQFLCHLRRCWLRHTDLAPYGMAAPEPDDTFLVSSGLMVQAFRAARMPDVPLAIGAVMNFTFGSIATAANHRLGNSYYGRDPVDLHAQALAALGPGVDDDLLGVVEQRFVDTDDVRFEEGLRALFRGLLADPTASG